MIIDSPSFYLWMQSFNSFFGDILPKDGLSWEKNILSYSFKMDTIRLDDTTKENRTSKASY